MILVSQCKKRVYPTEKAAKENLKKMKKHPNGKGGGSNGKSLSLLQVYHCLSCVGYHIGHSSIPRYTKRPVTSCPDLDNSAQ